MEDLDKTIAPRRTPAFEPEADLTMPGKRDRKPDGRFAVGDLIMNRYKVLSELGQGGMGVVYKCFDETAGIEVALKALPPELSHNTLEMDDIKDNFQLVHNLHHPNIASSNTLEKDNSNGNYYLIMECCEGEDLRRWIKRKRKEGELKLEDVLPIVKQVADALDYAHEMKIIHRDIKPGNIMIDQFGKIKVLDFGLAAQIHTSMTRVSMAYHGTSGTGPYMAPEQWRGRAQGAPADQYALAVMVYEMLAGRLPFESTDPAVLQQAVLTQNAEDIADIPKGVQTAIQRAMSKEPAERFENCSDFAAALEGKKIKAAKVQKKGGSPKWIAAVIALVLLVGGGTGYYLFSKSPAEKTAAEPVVDPVSPQPVPQSAPQPDPNPRKRSNADYDKENSLLDVEISTKMRQIRDKNYDRGQTFGNRLDDMAIFYQAAQKATLPDVKNQHYLKAKENADWLLKNGPEREESTRLKNMVLQAREQAVNYESKRFAAQDHAKAEGALRSGASLYEKCEFTKANKEYKTSLAVFQRIGRESKEKGEKIQDLTAQIEEEKGKNWTKVQRLARQILDIEKKNNFAISIDREATEKLAAVTSEIQKAEKAKDNWQTVLEHAKAAKKIESGNETADKLIQLAEKKLNERKVLEYLKLAKEAKGEKNWQKVSDYAVAALEIDDSNREAQNLKQEADNYLNPTLEIIATVDGKRVPATVKFRNKTLNTLEEKYKDLIEDYYYKGSLTYQVGDTEYVGEIEFTCNWKGLSKKRVTLEKVVFNGTVALPNGVTLEMVKVEPGSFTMSKRDGENGSDEVAHKKDLTKAFYIGKYEVTQEQWYALMKSTIRDQRDKANTSWPLRGEGDKYPVYYVSWKEAMSFCEKMNQYLPSDMRGKWKFTLPTETQWEFAARGGNRSKGYKYSGSDNLDDVGWYWSNSGSTTHEVGGKTPNELGLYDMSGNVWEWCLDNWQSKSDATRAEFDRPYHDEDGSIRVLRGGSWNNGAKSCRSAGRNYWSPGVRDPDLGFRLALVRVD